MSLAHRTFKDYDDYVYYQGGKARSAFKHAFILQHLAKNTQRFERVFRNASSHLKPGSVLCLGARSGAESLGAAKAGFKGSLGIDLHPVGPTVMRGDWHSLKFNDAWFANVFCNSLDHCLYLDRFCAEVKRVLVPDGRFYLMATNRQKPVAQWKGSQNRGTEALFWESSDELRDAICGYGFVVKHSWFNGKWAHYVFGVK